MFSDKLTKAIAEAAKTVMQNETWPDAASTSIYADKAGDAPISDTEASMDRKMTDESICPTCNGSGEGRAEGSTCRSCRGSGDSDSKCGKEMTDEGAITEADITEALKATQPASEWITDFVNSKDAKFKGKSKGERINMALGAYYAAQAGKSVKEGVEEPRSQGEKNFKAAHPIVKYRDVEQDDQTGTESMDQNAKPKLPIGTPFTKTEDVDGKKSDDKVAADIKSSAKRAVAPKASGAGKLKFTDAEAADAKTVSAINGSSKSATAPKATGSKQSGAQSVEKVSNSAPNGKLSAEYPKAGQKRPEAMPKGLKETALAALLGEDKMEGCMSSFDKQYANDNEKALKQLLSGQGTKDIDSRLLPQLNNFITAYGDELKKHLGLPIVDGEKKDVKEAIDSAVDHDDTGAFKGGSKQAGSMSSNDDSSDLTVVSDKIDNPVVTALNDLQLALDRCHGVVSRSESYSNPNLIMRIQNIQTLLADVAEELDAEERDDTASIK